MGGTACGVDSALLRKLGSLGTFVDDSVRSSGLENEVEVESVVCTEWEELASARDESEFVEENDNV